MEFITPVHLHDLELPKSDRFCVSDAEPASVVQDEEIMLANLQGTAAAALTASNSPVTRHHSETRSELSSNPMLISSNGVFDKLFSIVR